VGVSRIDKLLSIAALLMRTSTRPTVSLTVSAAALIEVSEVTSHWTMWRLGGWVGYCFLTSAGFRAAAKTIESGRVTSCLMNSRPMPLDAPVTKYTVFESVIVLLYFCDVGKGRMSTRVSQN